MTIRPMPWFEEAWITQGPDWAALWRLADQQGGIFTNADARKCGVRRSLLSHYALRGVFQRLHRGVYRLADSEPTRLDRIRAAWMAAAPARAVVSHETALFVLRLLDDEPWYVHMTLPREKRGKWPRKEVSLKRRVRFHVPRAGLSEDDLTNREGIVVTRPLRAIVDTLHSRNGCEGLGDAIRRAIERHEVDPRILQLQAYALGGRARWRVDRALSTV